MNANIMQKEREFFESERKRVPDLFLREPMVDSPEFLRSIGIEIFDDQLPIGYLRLMPQDFIVEEISQDGALHTVDVESSAVPPGEGKTVYADLVKAGISTLEAQSQIAEALSIKPESIGFAGIKDRLALTSQIISIRDSSEASVLGLQADNFFLKNIRAGKGAIANGDLQGNRFTIALRLQNPLSGDEISGIERQLNKIKQEGFWNFFSFQRFGTPRLLSHMLGLAIIKGDFEGAVKMFCTTCAPRELPYFQNIRRGIESRWGNWSSIRETLEKFPYHFSIELKFMLHLEKQPGDFLGALHKVPDQIRLWVYAYDSYLFNKKLSQLIKKGEVPLELPLLTSFSPQDWEPYKEFLLQDGVRIPSMHYKKFPFIRVASRTWPVLQKVQVHRVALRQKCAVFGFSLKKGTYATTLLMNFFTLASGMPIPKGIFADPIDAKEVLGAGSLQPALEKFKKVLALRLQDIAREPE